MNVLSWGTGGGVWWTAGVVSECVLFVDSMPRG